MNFVLATPQDGGQPWLLPCPDTDPRGVVERLNSGNRGVVYSAYAITVVLGYHSDEKEAYLKTYFGIVGLQPWGINESIL